jgi:hypothetical protein
MSSAHGNAAVDQKQLPADVAKKVQNIGYALAGIGVLIGAGAMFTDKLRFGFSYLVGFWFTITLALGALFFVVVQHLTRAGWSVAARRHMEWVSSGVLPFAAILFAPLAIFAKDIWSHWMGEHAAHDPVIVAKSAYLNTNAFFIRAVVYFVIWAVAAWWFAKKSRDQDKSGDPNVTLTMQSAAAPTVLVFALSITFAGFDWIMSLDPHWYSTIFGVYIFAGSVVGALAVLALMTVRLQDNGYLNKVSTVEHRHDIGKLLFGFVVFHAYIGFSQYFLIWYANIPEETIYFKHRWIESWREVSLLLVFGHFVVPFLLLLSRHVKRNSIGLTLGAVILLAMHYLDLYWMIMPNLDHHGAHFSWIDLGGLLMPLGIASALVGRKIAEGPLYPLSDPRLPETVTVENL